MRVTRYRDRVEGRVHPATVCESTTHIASSALASRKSRTEVMWSMLSIFGAGKFCHEAIICTIKPSCHLVYNEKGYQLQIRTYTFTTLVIVLQQVDLQLCEL